MTTAEIQALVDDCRSHDHIQHWHALHLLDAIETLLARDNIRTFAAQEVRIAELEAEVFGYQEAKWMLAGRDKELADLTAELARVKAESLRMVKGDDESDWRMTPSGLGVTVWDSGEVDYVRVPIHEGYIAWSACDSEPVRLERWETEE